MKKITIVGSGTAGLISSLILKKAFPLIEINIVYSSKIGIIGVGEGSTEHWRTFMEMCELPVVEVLNETAGTHKNGIRFENWTNHTPDYFHSVSAAQRLSYFETYTLYNGLVAQGKTLTENIGPRSMIENKVSAANPHGLVNQFHFDTFKLNNYLTRIATERGVVFIDKDVIDVSFNNTTGDIESVLLDDKTRIASDFWVDASGMKRILISRMKKQEWSSFSEYLQMDSAIAFPTASDPSGEIRPYTRARAMSSGWVWEIPTQERRGNGYVYSSRHCTETQAIDEVSKLLGFQVEPAKSIKFDPGHLEEMWIKNCVAIGLASAFVEPIEATSIGGTIQQVRCLVQNLQSYKPGCVSIQKNFNKKMNRMMENILAMISLHYISDRTDSPMWLAQKQEMKIPEYLQELLDLWQERSPSYYDVETNNYEMFIMPHLYHVAQGQKLLSKDAAERMISMYNIKEETKQEVFQAKLFQSSHTKVDHAEALRQIQI